MKKNENRNRMDQQVEIDANISVKFSKTEEAIKKPQREQKAALNSHKGHEEADSGHELSQEVYDEYMQLRSEFLENRDQYDNKACVNIGIQLNSTAILLTEIYEYDPQYYFEAQILTTNAYRKSKNYDVAEINLKKIKTGLKKLIGAQRQDSQVLYNYYIMCLKEFVILYANMQNFQTAANYEELLLGEDQEFFQDEDSVELKLAKAMILKSSNKFDQAIAILEDAKTKSMETVSSFLVVNLLTELASLYNSKGNVESAVYEINTALDILKNTRLINPETKRAFIETYTLKINFLTEFVKKIDVNNQDNDFDEDYSDLKNDIRVSYKELTSFILEEMQTKEALLEENLYVNPVHRYILYLGKNKDFKTAINLCDDMLTALRRYYSNFNKYVGYTLELKARLLAKKQELSKAKENYQAAYDIFTNLNDRNKGLQIKKSLEKLTKA